MKTREESKIRNLWRLISGCLVRYKKRRRAMGGRVSVEQAARIARIPLTEMLYVLNLAIYEPEENLTQELRARDWTDFDFL